MSVSANIDEVLTDDLSQRQLIDIYDSDDEQEIYGGDSQASGKRGGKKFVPSDPLHYQVFISRSGKPKMPVEFFATRYSPGNRIRGAVSGGYEKARCGSIYESLYFKVTHATGEFGNREPLVLFYDNPEQFERYWNMSVPQEQKDNWQARYVIAQRNFLNNDDLTI